MNLQLGLGLSRSVITIVEFSLRATHETVTMSSSKVLVGHMKMEQCYRNMLGFTSALINVTRSAEIPSRRACSNSTSGFGASYSQ